MLKDIFNDTIRASFYPVISTISFLSTIYHLQDILIFPTNHTGRTISFSTEVDLTTFTSPYLFLLLGLSSKELKVSSHGKPSIILTVDIGNN